MACDTGLECCDAECLDALRAVPADDEDAGSSDQPAPPTDEPTVEVSESVSTDGG